MRGGAIGSAFASVGSRTSSPPSSPRRSSVLDNPLYAVPLLLAHQRLTPLLFHGYRLRPELELVYSEGLCYPCWYYR